ncbi:MAG: aldo/keto reductase [Candidatus Sericytochromatia bacterium]
MKPKLPTFTLSNQLAMPSLGLGVYQSPPGEVTRAAVLASLDAGYRLIDTAALYGNEEDVGAALKAAGLPREEVFVTTKLWNEDHGDKQALQACERSLQQLGLDYLDLYLIHWPVHGLRSASWKALEALYREGRVRAIGVSNYTVRHLRELLAACEIAPMVNQVEFHPFLYQRELLEFCRGHQIQLQAYSPLTRGQRLDDPRVLSIAQHHGKSPAQILIRWCLQHEVGCLPKSVHPQRISENADVFDFELSPAEMAGLDACNEFLHTCWDPTNAP